MRSRDAWWRRFGPIVLSTWRRRYWVVVATAWVALAVLFSVVGHFGLLWLPAFGLVGSLSVLLRDRAGRRRMLSAGEMSRADDARDEPEHG
jgi:hypothetical protein